MVNDMITEFSTGSSLEISENLTKDLKEFAQSGNRQEVLSRIKDLFIASRAEANSLSENVRSQALRLLESRLDTMSTPQLIRTIELLTSSNQNDFASILGINPAGRGVNVNINTQNNTQTLIKNDATNPVRNTIQDANDLLEGISLIANKFKVKNEGERLLEPSSQIIDAKLDD